MKKQDVPVPQGLKNLTVTAMLLAAALVLSIVEHQLPSLPIAVPGVKLGLSNIPVMYALFFVGRKQSFTIAALKSFTVVLQRGVIAGVLSLCGGWLSLLVMSLLLWLFRERISYWLLSLFGAVFHNIGQFIAICLIYTNIYLWIYLPALLLFGAIAGTVTALLLKFILPALKRLDLK